MLFVAHREEILNQALDTFRRIRPQARLGHYTGDTKDPHADVVFASIQTLSKREHLDRFAPNDFDYVIAIDYNRVKGTPPNDPTRPGGVEKGGSIWLHMDHGSGTSACVSLSQSAMEYLLRTLDPEQRPVVVMGDRADLTA